MASLDSNIIKAIFPDEYELNENFPDELVEKYYRTDNIYLNTFQVPDQLTNINRGHCISSYVRTTPDDYSKITDDITYMSPLIDMNIDIKELNNSYHKLLSGKDIDWENAYLRYAKVSYDALQEPIIYYDINPNTGQEENRGETSSYIYYTNIPSRINNTYELMIIIDYLFMKIKSLQFFMENVKQQNTNAQAYNLTKNSQNSENSPNSQNN